MILIVHFIFVDNRADRWLGSHDCLRKSLFEFLRETDLLIYQILKMAVLRDSFEATKYPHPHHIRVYGDSFYYF
jgi:hypothetical protein